MSSLEHHPRPPLIQVDQDYRSHSPLMLACECELQDGVDTHQKGDIHRVRLLLDLGASAAFKNKVLYIIVRFFLICFYMQLFDYNKCSLCLVLCMVLYTNSRKG